MNNGGFFITESSIDCDFFVTLSTIPYRAYEYRGGNSQ